MVSYDEIGCCTGQIVGIPNPLISEPSPKKFNQDTSASMVMVWNDLAEGNKQYGTSIIMVQTKLHPETKRVIWIFRTKKYMPAPIHSTWG